MEKHAYLIMAHTNFRQVAKLVEILDDAENDIYLHIDKKVKKSYEIYIEIIKPMVKQSKIYFVSQHTVHWGGYSQIATEIELLKAALHEKYSYYHLISGADLPLKNQSKIHDFFEKNNGKEFVQFGTSDYIRNIKDRFQYYWFGQEFIENGQGLIKSICSKIRYTTILLQKLIKVNRRKKLSSGFQYGAGANWFSITYNLAKYIVSREDDIRKIFKYSICCDEVFIQTMILNSKFKKNVYHKNFDGDYKAIMRNIDWNRGNPYVWHNQDYEELMHSDYLFARKFDETIDAKIIEKIYSKLMEDKRK